MRVNWGFKIGALYAGFVIMILGMVSLTMGEKVELVSKDYYAQELAYQDKIDKLNKTNRLEEPLTWELKPSVLVLKFPGEFCGISKSGNIYFFNPSDATKDKKIRVPPDTSSIRNIHVNHLEKGLYKIQVNWEVNSTEYLSEGIIQVN